jgi:hypothetical protein
MVEVTIDEQDYLFVEEARKMLSVSLREMARFWMPRRCAR